MLSITKTSAIKSGSHVLNHAPCWDACITCQLLCCVPLGSIFLLLSALPGCVTKLQCLCLWRRPGEEEHPPVRRPMDIKYLQRQIRMYNDMAWIWKPGYIM